VREALRVLTVDGLLTRRPNRSVMVRHLTVDEVEDIYRARQMLEGACMRAAADCPEEILQELARVLDVYVREVHTNDPQRAAEAHVEFHTSMVRILSQSEWLAELERSMMRHLLLIIASVHRSKYSLEREIELHRSMCELCIARRIDEALTCLEDGFVESKAFAIKFTFEALMIARIKEENS
jgi:DNA-binding GntR family transcriptional regulator